MGCFKIYYGEFDGSFCRIPFSMDLTIDFIPIMTFPEPYIKCFEVRFFTPSRQLCFNIGECFYVDLENEEGKNSYIEVSSKFSEYFANLVDFGAKDITIKKSELDKKITNIIDEVLKSKNLTLEDLKPKRFFFS